MELLTGATGFLGRHLARRLTADGRTIRALVRPGTDLKRIPPEIREIVWGGLDDHEAVGRAVAGTTAIVHAAARVARPGGRAAFEADNVAATEALLAAASRAGVRRLVYVSSIGIYGTPSGGASLTESSAIDAALEKRGAYAWSKAEGDRRVRAYADRNGLETVVVRPGILYGGEQKPFVARLQIPVPRGRGRRLIIASRDALLPLTHVDNACDAIALALTRGRSGAAYNVVDGLITQGEYLDLLIRSGVVSLRPIYLAPAFLYPVAVGCEMVSRVTGRSLPFSRYRLRRATESLRYETEAARQELGWSPAIDLGAGIEDMRRNAALEQRAAA